ncbi:MAG: ankyrin repeat domain-containing protein [Bryobacteraceae bacterium]
MRLFAAVLLSASALLAQGEDFSPDLLQAAQRGRDAQVKAFLDDGANIEAVDKDGRTPLMLAAQHGHAATVELLLGRGAKADARDRQGATAYVLALFSPAGNGKHEAVLKLLPTPPRPKLALDVRWSPVRLVSSCFGTRQEMARVVDAFHPAEQFLRAFGAYVQSSGRNLVELVGKPSDADALLRVELQPASACVAQAGDHLSLSIEVRIFRQPGMTMILQKLFGAGIKGLHARTVANLEQYAPVIQAWIKPQAGPIYWAAAAELYRFPIARP